MRYFITAIGTDCGKTLSSAILCEALKADYWKPVQAGLPRDTDAVKQLVTNTITRFHEETYLLKTPASPHAAASLENKTIRLTDFKIPSVNNTSLIIEGAGGCLVPLNDHDFVIDLADAFQCEIILVADLYLGSINHTLLTAHFLKSKGLSVKGIIFNKVQDEYNASEEIILKHTGYPCLLRIANEKIIDREKVLHYTSKLLMHFHE